MDEICEQLDKICLQIFDVLESLYEAQGQLEQVMKDGFLGISRARYNLGVKRISADQFVDADLVATRTVVVKDENLGCDFKVPGDCNSISRPTFELQINTVTLKPKSDGSEEKEILIRSHGQAGPKGLRQRKPDKATPDTSLGEKSELLNSNVKDGQEVDSKKMDSEVRASSSSEKREKVFNPINFFGVLVPQHLRSSQKNFEEAVRLAVKIADLKSELSSLRTSHGSLREKKQSISSSDATNPEA